MQRQRLPAHDGYCLVRREITPIVFEHGKIECGDQSICRVASHQINLFLAEGAVQQTQIHGPGSSGKPEAVSFSETLESIGPLHEFVPKPGPPLWGVWGRSRDGVQMQPARVLSADHNGER